MADINIEKLSLLPEEMFAFTLSSVKRTGPRLGQLAIKGRSTIKTPHYIANTSRGVIPHISQDNLAKYCSINGLYMGLEDFIEKHPPRIPPIFSIQRKDGDTLLRNFTAHEPDKILILGPRRFPPVDSPVTNTNKTVAICTSVGFRTLEVEYYINAATKLKPDIVLGPSDFVLDPKPSNKRAEKMCDRTTLWIREILAEKDRIIEEGSDLTVFAPILPLPLEQQQWYLDTLVEEFRDGLSGLYVHDAYSVVDLPVALDVLPRLALTDPAGPSELLTQISLGVDLFVLPFIAKAADCGIALDFVFPPPTAVGDSACRAIGIDAWDEGLAMDVTPFQAGCECYACTKHHRAYLHHLLSAKEMLAWVLLQIHNHHVLDQFFAGVRTSIATGTFDEDRIAFERFYESKMPTSNGLGPRIRGYQTKSMSSGESKKKAKSYNNLDDMAKSLENHKAVRVDEAIAPRTTGESGEL